MDACAGRQAGDECRMQAPCFKLKVRQPEVFDLSQNLLNGAMSDARKLSAPV